MLVCLSANAQDKLTYGVKAGFNAAMIGNMDASIGLSYFRPSFHVGAFAEWKFNRFFGVAPELVYSGQGTGIDILTLSTDITQKYKFNYINIPVMAKIYPVKWLSIDLGPQAGFLVSAKVKTETTERSNGTSERETKTTDVKGDMNKFDFGVAGGLTFNFGKHVFLQTRYTLGLTEVFKKNDDLNNDKHTNQVIQIGLGARF